MSERMRPRCKRCSGPLDLWREDGIWKFWCNNLRVNPNPLAIDDEFWKRWDNLPGDDVARLEREVQPGKNTP